MERSKSFGDAVRVTYNGQTFDAVVIAKSPNRKSLVIEFDRGVRTPSGGTRAEWRYCSMLT